MKTNKNTSKIILSIIVALLATMISYSGFKSMNSKLSEQQQLIQLMQSSKSNQNKGNYAYVVAVNNLKAGEIVADTDIDVKPFDIENKDAFDNRADVVNKILLKDIQSGEVVSSEHIARISKDKVSMREGYRALTLPAESFQGRSSKMRQGDFVDIYSASGENSWSLEGIRILGFDAPAPAADAAPDFSQATSITFEVPKAYISDFIANVSKSKLVLVARDPNDKKVVRRIPRSFSSGSGSLSGIPSLPNLPSSVPIENMGSIPTGTNSALPLPLQPAVNQQSVEVIEANVKSKVTFD